MARVRSQEQAAEKAEAERAAAAAAAAAANASKASAKQPASLFKDDDDDALFSKPAPAKVTVKAPIGINPMAMMPGAAPPKKEVEVVAPSFDEPRTFGGTRRGQRRAGARERED